MHKLIQQRSSAKIYNTRIQVKIESNSLPALIFDSYLVFLYREQTVTHSRQRNVVIVGRCVPTFKCWRTISSFARHKNQRTSATGFLNEKRMRRCIVTAGTNNFGVVTLCFYKKPSSSRDDETASEVMSLRSALR